MLISIGKFNFKKYFFLFVPLIKIIKESTNLYNAFYNVPNILIQYFFLCISKFANVIFWFILNFSRIRQRLYRNEHTNDTYYFWHDVFHSVNWFLESMGASRKSL